MASRDTKTSGLKLGLASYTLDASSNSFTVATDGYNQLIIYAQHTNSAATALTFAITEDPGDGTEYTLQEEDVASGVVTLSDRTYTHAVSGDDDFRFGIPVDGAGNLTVTITDTGGGSSDSLIVYYKLAVL
jgi:hypothetical protein